MQLDTLAGQMELNTETVKAIEDDEVFDRICVLMNLLDAHIFMDKMLEENTNSAFYGRSNFL